jgi:hypothetical protein
MADTVTKKFLDFFNIGYKKGAKEIENKLYPTREKEKNGKVVRVRETFPPEVEKYWTQWIHSTHDDAESWNNRIKLYEDCDMVYYNSPLIAKAMELVTNETIQADTNEQPVTIEAKRKVRQYIEEFFDKIDLNSLIKPTIASIVQYGNAGWILSFDGDGVDKIILSNVYDLKERMEFSPAKIREMIAKDNKFLKTYRSKVHRIDQLIDMIENKDNIASYYDKYLFGFQIGEYVLPPWRYIHFRNMTIKSPFDPYGVPVFIHSIGPYRQYDSAMTMQMAARGAQLPIDIYKLNFPNVMNATEKMASAMEFIAEWQNSGINQVNKEEIGVGETIVTINELIEFDQIVSDIELGKLDDIELLRDDIIQSTMLPRYMIDQNDGGFGDSGVALTEKWKPFARMVYHIQSIFLKNLSQVVKIHLLHTGEFSLDEVDFVLKMPYPESQVNDEIIDSQSSLKDLATSIIDDFSDKFFDGDIDAMPDEVIRDIYHQFLPYDDKTIDRWMDEIMKSKNVSDEFDEKTQKIKSKMKLKKLQEKFGGRRAMKEVFGEVIFENKQQKLREGAFRGKHYYSSKVQSKDFSAEWLRLLDIKKMGASDKQKLKEELKETAEEMEYEFTFNNEKTKKRKSKKKK